ncbi:MAG: hypothetical protein AB1714_05745 [Acidobacteriota bacterium]
MESNFELLEVMPEPPDLLHTNSRGLTCFPLYAAVNTVEQFGSDKVRTVRLDLPLR